VDDFRTFRINNSQLISTNIAIIVNQARKKTGFVGLLMGDFKTFLIAEAEVIQTPLVDFRYY